MLRIAVALMLLYVVVRCSQATFEAPAEGRPEKPATVARITTWQTESARDALSGKDIMTTSIESENLHEFKRPYEGGSHLSLVVRRHPRTGTDVFVVLSEGQLTCEYRNCRVGWRVDDRPIRYPEAIRPVDGSHNLFFLGSHEELIKELQGGKRLVVLTTVHSNGDRQWEFNVNGFQRP